MTQGSIDEVVSVTGNVTPVMSVTLGFGNSGIISQVGSSIGKTVTKGQLLAKLNTSDLSSQIRQAQANVNSQLANVATQQANVATQQAKLEGLKAGTREEDVTVSQASLEKAQQDLANMYAGVMDIATDSYTKANDAIRVQLDQFFTNSETLNPKLGYITADSQAEIDSEQ